MFASRRWSARPSRASRSDTPSPRTTRAPSSLSSSTRQLTSLLQRRKSKSRLGARAGGSGPPPFCFLSRSELTPAGVVTTNMPLVTEREKGAHLLRRFGLGASEAELDYY